MINDLDGVRWTGITGIASNPDNPDEVYVTFDGFWDAPAGSGVGINRVMRSTDGGLNWYDYSEGLREFPVNCIIYQRYANTIFIGTDIGVFYRQVDNPNSQWECFNKDLPICAITSLDINYSARLIRAATFGRGIWESSLPECLFSLTPLVISATPSSPWNSDKELYCDLIIDEPATLTITARLSMSPQAKVVVKPGAKLVLDGGTITTVCKDMWQGIEVWGDNNWSQFIENGIQHQGYLELKNGATVENAHYAISVQNPNIWNSFGGIVKANNATFKNNWKSVGFMTYSNYYPVNNNPPNPPAPNQSKFEDCHFIIDDNFYRNSFQAQVTMWDVDGIFYTGCEFSDNRTNMTESSRMGDGIYSEDANYTVNALCDNTAQPVPCPIEDLKPSSFSGFYHGISALGSLFDQSVTVSQANFTKNLIGVSIKGTNHTRVLQSTFTIGNNSAQDVTKHYGIFSLHSNGYRFEENLFTGVTPTNNFTYGIFIYNSGPFYNETYLNKFYSLNYAEIGKALNRDINNTYIGLQFLCNENHNAPVHGIDFWSDKDVNFLDWSDHGIRDYQGQVTLSAGNVFTHDPLSVEGDFTNTTRNPLHYYYATGEEPLYYTTNYVFPTPISTSNTCPSNIGTHDPIKGMSSTEELQAENQYLNYKSNYNNLIYVYHQLRTC